ncbi:MAG: PAAR domain-containing protein [Pseudomonadota bacterium]
MKDAQGRGVIRLGDRTTHGGEVVSAAADFKVLGKAVACEGDMATCPNCHGKHAIGAPGSTRRHHGKAVAYDGDPTACGAKLISSL